jgi:hypothetical protein
MQAENFHLPPRRELNIADRSSVPRTFAVPIFEKFRNLSHTKSRGFANVHSAGLHSFVVSRSARLRPATHTNSSRCEATPGDTFDVTAQDVCVPGYAKKVRAVPACLKRQA